MLKKLYTRSLDSRLVYFKWQIRLQITAQIAKQFGSLTILGAVLEKKEVYAWAESQLLRRFTSDGWIPSNIRNLSFEGTLNGHT